MENNNERSWGYNLQPRKDEGRIAGAYGPTPVEGARWIPPEEYWPKRKEGINEERADKENL
jgi:hypothetical protein